MRGCAQAAESRASMCVEQGRPTSPTHNKRNILIASVLKSRQVECSVSPAHFSFFLKNTTWERHQHTQVGSAIQPTRWVCEGVGPDPHTRSDLEFLEWTGARMAMFWTRKLKNYPWDYVCIVNRLLIGVHAYWG